MKKVLKTMILSLNEGNYRLRARYPSPRKQIKGSVLIIGNKTKSQK